MLPDPPVLAAFVAAALVVLVVPGPAVLYIVARSLEQGRLAGVVSTFGVGAGALVHVGAAAAGISAVLASSAAAFSVVKYLGAAYLVWLGIRRLREPDARRGGAPAAGAGRAPRALAALFGHGIVVNVLNPKTALFFLAFLPQFVDPGRGPVAVQMLALGALFVTLGIASDGAYAVLAGTVGARLRGRPGLARVQRRATGGVLIALGVGAALAQSGRG